MSNKYHIETDKGTYEIEVEDAQPPQAKSPDMASTLYHGAIEGGAMTVGGLAGTAMAGGNPLGGVALGAAMYPPAKRAAESIDAMRGIQVDPPSPFKEFGQGVAIEAGSAALKPIAGVAAKLLPGAKAGEAISGTPRANLSRAFKQGFSDTYIKPKPLAEASEAFGKTKFDMVGKTITPEEQVGMMVNPKGEANQKVADVMLKWLKNEPIGADEALAARQGADTIFPPDVAKAQGRRGGLSQFKTAMNEIIAEQNPAFAEANKDYAASKLRSDLLKPARVNKSNPDQYSKLGAMLNVLGAGAGYKTGHLPAAIAATLGTSPLAAGVASSIAGDVSRSAIPEAARRAVLAEFISRMVARKGKPNGQ